jgi:group I intron endonuclease
MIIYKTTNLINGKIYIGQTTTNNLYYFGSGKIIKQAFKKYGKENFKREILEYCTSIKELNEREKYWIEKLKSQDKNIGYNVDDGGTENWNKINLTKLSESHKNQKPTEAMKLHLSEINSGINHPQYGTHHSEETLKKMSKPRSENGKKNISDSHKGQIPWNKGLKYKADPTVVEKQMKKVYQYDMNDNFIAEYKSIKEAKELTKIGNISHVCVGKRISSGGFKWSFTKL